MRSMGVRRMAVKEEERTLPILLGARSVVAATRAGLGHVGVGLTGHVGVGPTGHRFRSRRRGLR